jgi:Tfp pilus assembly protein FimT
MLVVMVLALLAGAMGSMGFGTWKRMSVDKSARELLLAAKYARVIAIEKQVRCKLMIDEANNSYLLTVPGTGPQAEGAQTIISNEYAKPRQFDGEVTFEQVQITSLARGEAAGGEKMIVFRPDGTADTAVLQIGDGKNHCTVYIMAATGKGRIEVGEAKEAGAEFVDLDVDEW